MSVESVMRAQILTGHGGLEKLEYHRDWPVPQPGSCEVLVEVMACGVNNTDINTRVGWYEGGAWGDPIRFPRIQGADPVGTIVDAGPEVKRARIGQRVIVDPWLRGSTLAEARYLGSEVDGGFAGYVVVPDSNAWSVESDLSDVELATFACSFSTAEHMLERARVLSGQWVMVSGASGGVGSALIQLSKRRQAQVLALTSADKIAPVSELGADVVLDRGIEDLPDQVMAATGGVDVFADVVGGNGFGRLLETVRQGGAYAVSGAVAGSSVELDLRTLYLRDLTLHGATVVPHFVFENLVGYIDAGEVRAIVDRVFSLDELQSAQEYFSRREHVGSVVIEVGRPV